MTEERGHFVASGRVLIFAGLFLLVFGSYGAWHFIRSLEPLTWKAAPCTVTRFTTKDNPASDRPFGAEVTFRFEAHGSCLQGRELGIPGWKEAEDQLRHMLRFEDDPVTTCYLPNGKPEDAVLLRPPPNWAGLAFVGFSLSVGWILYQADRNRHASTGAMSRKLMPILALFFGTPGAVLLFSMSMPVWLESMHARSWKETPATIIWSEIRTHRSSRSTSYRADICYEYRAAGRTWRQNRIRPGAIHGGGSGSAREMARDHPPGAKIICHVDPQHPERAVMFRNAGWPVLFTLFPLPFIAIAAMLAWSWLMPDKP